MVVESLAAPPFPPRYFQGFRREKKVRTLVILSGLFPQTPAPRLVTEKGTQTRLIPRPRKKASSMAQKWWLRNPTGCGRRLCTQSEAQTRWWPPAPRLWGPPGDCGPVHLPAGVVSSTNGQAAPCISAVNLPTALGCLLEAGLPARVQSPGPGRVRGRKQARR